MSFNLNLSILYKLFIHCLNSLSAYNVKSIIKCATANGVNRALAKDDISSKNRLVVKSLSEVG